MSVLVGRKSWNDVTLVGVRAGRRLSKATRTSRTRSRIEKNAETCTIINLL